MVEKNCHPNLRILFENDFGYIGKCFCCEEIQFCIGNVVSFMPEDAFLRLYRSFQRVNNKVTENLLRLPNGEKIVLRTPVDNFLLSLSIDEFRQVMDIFDSGVANLRLLDSLARIENMN